MRTVVRLQMRAPARPCVLQERGTELLADPTGRIHPPAATGLRHSHGRSTPTDPPLLVQPLDRPLHPAGDGQGEIEITRAAFELMTADTTVNYLRDLLVAVGVLPFTPS